MFVTRFTTTPQVGQEFTVDRPDWFATGHVTNVTPHIAITGHNGVTVTRAVDPNRFDVEVMWDTNSGTDTVFHTTVNVAA